MAADKDDDDGKTVFVPAGGLPGQSPGGREPGPKAGHADMTAAEDDWFRDGPAQPAPDTPPPAEPMSTPPASQSSWNELPDTGASWSDTPSPAPGWSGDADRTMYAPAGDTPAAAPTPFGGGSSGPPPLPPTAHQAAPAAPVERTGITIGETLNGIYAVRRFLARGGMGEVYEGVNVHTDERVAIKVILPHLAADLNVQAMFRKEARTLTRLADPALVQYRVLAEEPRFGVFYIVTEFIDGHSLADAMGKLQPSENELRGLIRRLAMGLRTAHDLGAIHRDLSPDNVLLPGGNLAQAKVIDFGIAKDLDASTGTIVGDGFAGKLGYVAPEQFGDFDRSIGPWTDVYSLALVILALAGGRPPDMGSTIVDAIDRRRKGPDLSAAPEGLRPLLGEMLKPNPVDRLRSMDAVIEALAHGGAGVVSRTPSSAARPVKSSSGGRPPIGVLIGGGVALVAALGVGAVFLLKPHPSAPTSTPATAPATVPAGGAAPPTAARVIAAADPVISTVPCTWYEVRSVSNQGGVTDVRVTGVSGNLEATHAFEDGLQRALGGTVRVHEEGVAPLAAAACPALEAVRAFRAAPSEAGRWVTPAQYEFQFGARVECGNDPKKALTAIDIADKGPDPDLSVIGWEGNGKLQAIFTGLSEFDRFKAALAKTPFNRVFETTAAGKRLNICADTPGYQGMLVVHGASPSALGLPSLTAGDGALPGPDFPQKFAAAAKAGGWRTQMAWYRVASPGGAGG